MCEISVHFVGEDVFEFVDGEVPGDRQFGGPAVVGEAKIDFELGGDLGLDVFEYHRVYF